MAQFYNGYSEVMFSSQKYRNVMAKLVRTLPAFMDQVDTRTIVVTGKSGMAIAFALQLFLDVDIVVIRKGESSHGDHIEGNGTYFDRYIFLDDFISSAGTYRRVKAELAKAAAIRNWDTPRCVGIVEYQHYGTAQRHREYMDSHPKAKQDHKFKRDFLPTLAVHFKHLNKAPAYSAPI